MTAPESWYATRTMAAIELVAFRPASATEVANALQVHPRTARRLLNRLVQDGYLTRPEGERREYAPTMRLVALAGQIVERAALPEALRSYVGQLHERTGVAAHLAVPSYRHALCLVHCGEDAPEPAPPQLRELVPCHATAAGKALLAHRHPWRASVVSQSLERYTDRTLTTAAAIEREVVRVRERGCAIEDREYRADMRAIAAPVFNAAGQAIAALGVSSALDGLPGERLLLHSATVREVAFAASCALGYEPRSAHATLVASHA